MKVKDLQKKLEALPQSATIYVSSDEELNTIFKDIELNELTPTAKGIETAYVLFGLSGTELL